MDDCVGMNLLPNQVYHLLAMNVLKGQDKFPVRGAQRLIKRSLQQFFAISLHSLVHVYLRVKSVPLCLRSQISQPSINKSIIK